MRHPLIKTFIRNYERRTSIKLVKKLAHMQAQKFPWVISINKNTQNKIMSCIVSGWRPTFPTYCGSGPMCSSKTKNWFQIQPRFGLWCTSVSPLASLVWFLVGTLAGVWWLTPEHLWMKQRQTRNGQRQELVGIRMVLLCGFVRLSLCSEVAGSCQR